MLFRSAERSLYAKYGQHLVKDTFIAMEHGPVPSHLYDALKLMNGKGTNKDVKAISDILRRHFIHTSHNQSFYI